MSRKLENGAVVNPDNLTTSVPQSTQEDVASLRESLTEDIATIARHIPALDIRIDNKVNENGQQETEKRTVKKTGEILERPLFVLSYNSISGSGKRTPIIGNSSKIRAAVDVFLEDPALAEAVKSDRLARLTFKLTHARSIVAKLEKELAILS